MGLTGVFVSPTLSLLTEQELVCVICLQNAYVHSYTLFIIVATIMIQVKLIKYSPLFNFLCPVIQLGLGEIASSTILSLLARLL